MISNNDPSKNKKLTVCLVSPFPPPYGGMAIQADKISEVLKSEGCHVHKVRTNAIFKKEGYVNKVPVLRTFSNLSRFLRDLDQALRNTDIVYFLTGFQNFFFWVTYPALLLIFSRRKPVILSARGGNAENFFEKYGILVKPVLQKVDLVSTPSLFLKDVFSNKLGIKADIIPNIADLDQFVFRKRKVFEPRILVTRNLEDIYGIDVVLRAFALVRQRYSDAVMGLAGEGKLRGHLEKMAFDLGVENHVTFYGSVDHQQIQHLYAEYDIYINASRIDNMPGSILEAFASGLPVISTRAGGIPNMVEHGVTGLLVDIDDYKALAENIFQIIENPNLGISMAEYAFLESHKFTRKKTAAVLIHYLRQYANCGSKCL